MSKSAVGIPGVYDVVVYYWDENDGQASSKVSVDGVVVDSWVWNKELGSSGTNASTYTTRVIKNVAIDGDARIVIEGFRDGGEPLRIDKVVLAPPSLTAAQKALPAFEGAEGFGAASVGGRGGWIVKVTNLNDSGEGSLRWALEDLDMPRIVVFDVGGLITLSKEIYVNGRVTVAGQTAPGDGITVRGGKLQVIGDDVIIRGLKLRPGDGPGQELDLRDAISVGTASHAVSNVIIDSNSLSWATDEVATVWGDVRNVTYSNNIIAEALDRSAMTNPTIGKGMLISNGASGISVIGNYFANSVFRNPTVGDVVKFEFLNNYVYNHGQHALTFSDGVSGTANAHVIGNVFEKGPSSGGEKAVRILTSADGRKFYLKDNYSWDRTSDDQSDRLVASGSLRATLVDSLIFTPSDTDVMSPGAVKASVLANAGARAQGLDAVDARILGYATNGGGIIIKSPSDVGGYNVPTAVTTRKDTDKDGVPDIYETFLGSDKFVFDPHRDVDGNGYSVIEDYINGLIDGRFDGIGGEVKAVSVEAETLRLAQGFAVEAIGSASGGALIRGGLSTAMADYVFTGGAGVYDITVRYADENDGASRLAVSLDGVVLDEWLWTASLGSAFPGASTLTQRVIRNVDLAPGQVVALSGRGDGGEPLRVDRIDFTPAGDTSSSGPAPVGPFRIEAEAATASTGFALQNHSLASGGYFIAAANGVTASASYTLFVPQGVYDIAIRHSDENDAVAQLAVFLNGDKIDEWLWDRDLAGPLVNAQTLVDRVISDVAIAPGDILAVTGQGTAGEPLRIDSFLLTPVDALV